MADEEKDQGSHRLVATRSAARSLGFYVFKKHRGEALVRKLAEFATALQSDFSSVKGLTVQSLPLGDAHRPGVSVTFLSPTGQVRFMVIAEVTDGTLHIQTRRPPNLDHWNYAVHGSGEAAMSIAEHFVEALNENGFRMVKNVKVG